MPAPFTCRLTGSFYDHPAEQLNKAAEGGKKAEQKSAPVTEAEVIEKNIRCDMSEDEGYGIDYGKVWRSWASPLSDDTL